MNAFVAVILALAVANTSASHIGLYAHHHEAHIPSGSVAVSHDGAVIAGPSGSIHTDNGIHGHGASARLSGPAGDVGTHGGHARLAGPGLEHGHHAYVAPIAHHAVVAPVAHHAAIVGPTAHATIVGPTAHAAVVAPAVAHHSVYAAVPTWGHHGVYAHGHHGW